jgi:hypothetical protein
MRLFRHGGPEEPAPYPDTRASRRRPDESREPSQILAPGLHREPWIPAFAGMTTFLDTLSLWTDSNYIERHKYLRIEKIYSLCLSFRA